MRAHVLVALAAGLLFASHEQRQEADAEQNQLRILENQVLEALRKREVDTLQDLLRPDYVDIAGPGPERMTKPELLKSLALSHVTAYTLEDVRMVRLNRDAAILTYKLMLKGVPDEKGPFANPAYVSSTWVRQDMAWLSVFRQWTLLSKEAAGPQRITAFEALLTPNSVRYVYKGTTKLEDVHANLEIRLIQGTVSTEDYWGTWDPGEAKEINLGFLASGVSSVERIELSARATMGGKRVLCFATSRRDAKIPIDWKAVPPTLKLP